MTETTSHPQGYNRQQRILLIVSIIGLTIVIGGAVVLVARGIGRTSDDGASEERVALDPTIGPDDAPVTVVEFGDFGCPSCRAWHNAGIRQQILAAYGDQVRFVFKDFPVVTTQSPRAAEAGQCALDQGKFWEYHDFVYENFQGLDDGDLQFYAVQIGLDLDTFQTCLDLSSHTATVRADWQEAEQFGLPGTPSFLINGEPLIGVPYYESFVTLIDQALAAS